MKPVSPLADFSFDYQDLHFRPADAPVGSNWKRGEWSCQVIAVSIARAARSDVRLRGGPGGASRRCATRQPQTAATLQEVVVTAQKRQEKLINVPMGVTAITSRRLQSMHLVDFADLRPGAGPLGELTAPASTA